MKMVQQIQINILNTYNSYKILNGLYIFQSYANFSQEIEDYFTNLKKEWAMKIGNLLIV